jgi:hypothetical protein
VAENSTGYFGVTLVKRSQLKPYKARVRRGGKQVDLGMFATTVRGGGAVRRALAGGGGAAAGRAAVEALPTSEEARQQAQAEKLELRQV